MCVCVLHAGRVPADTLAERPQVWADDGSSGAGSPAGTGLCHTHEPRSERSLVVNGVKLLLLLCIYIHACLIYRNS